MKITEPDSLKIINSASLHRKTNVIYILQYLFEIFPSKFINGRLAVCEIHRINIHSIYRDISSSISKTDHSTLFSKVGFLWMCEH